MIDNDNFIIVYNPVDDSNVQDRTKGEYSELLKELSEIRKEYNDKVSSLRHDYYTCIERALAKIQKLD